MWTLAFDTTTNFCSIALFKGNLPKAVFSSEMTFGQSEVLIPEIQKMLQNADITLQDLNLLVVCTGPGSFTGVRSSLSAARAFGLTAENLTLCGINAFDVYAADLKEDQRADRIAVIIETKREDFYVAYYDRNLKKVSTPKTALYDEIIHDLQGNNVTFTGDGAQRFLSKPSGLHLHEASFETHPSVERLALEGINRFNAQRADFPKPLYLKSADICVK